VLEIRNNKEIAATAQPPLKTTKLEFNNFFVATETSKHKESLPTTLPTSTSSVPNKNKNVNKNKNKNGVVPGSAYSRDTTTESPGVIDLLKDDNNNNADKGGIFEDEEQRYIDCGNATEVTRKVDSVIDKAEGRNTMHLLEGDNNDEDDDPKDKEIIATLNENLNDQVPQRISSYCRSNPKDPNQVANKTIDRPLTTGKEDNVIDLLDDDEDDDEVIIVEKSCQFIEREIKDDDDNINGELHLLGSTGKNALSDFAHSRADCVTYPFAKDPTRFCIQCYCYVCDAKASECIKWNDHCKAINSETKWKQRRSQVRCKRKAPERELERLHFFGSSSLPVDRRSRRTRRNVNYSER